MPAGAHRSRRGGTTRARDGRRACGLGCALGVLGGAAVAAAAGPAAAGAPAEVTAGGAPMFDLLLRGGRVLDPASGVDGVRDVAIAGARIARVHADIPPRLARRVVDVRGLVVAPGLIDLHAHVGRGGDGRPWHPPDLYLSSGATTVVDAGSFGARHFDFFREQIAARARVRVLAFLNVVSTGMADEALEQEVDLMDVPLALATIARHRDLIVGVKSAHYWTRLPFDEAHPPWASVDRALEVGRRAGLPVMVDFWPRPPARSYPDLLARLRPGDIHTHLFAQQFPVLDARGRVADHLRAARARGVLFDLGHGAGSFWFRNAVPAIRQGFVPDTLGTDLHGGNVNGPVVDMANVLSKIVAMGVPRPEAIRRATVNPARAIGRPELGTLAPGSEADVAVLRVEHGRFGYSDCGQARMVGRVRLRNLLTVRAGEIAYDPEGLSMVEWSRAPAQYFSVPALQGDAPATADPERLRRFREAGR